MGFKNKPHFQRLSWCCNFFLTLLCVVTFAFDLYFIIALTHPRYANHHYANHTPNAVAHDYKTQITPATWIFMIWVVLYAILIIWFAYVFYLLLCRQSCSRDNKQPLFSGFFWFFFAVVNVLHAIWLYLFVHHEILISGIILLVLMIILYVINIMAHRVCWLDQINYNNNNNNNCNNNNPNDDNIELLGCEITLLKILTLNALPLYAMCCTISACFHWTIIFKYFLFHLSDNVSSIITLAILSMLLVIYWSLELLFKREYFVWTWLPTFALIAFFIAIIVKHPHMGVLHAPGLFFTCILLAVSGITILLKSCGLCFCYPKSPNPRFSHI